MGGATSMNVTVVSLTNGAADFWLIDRSSGGGAPPVERERERAVRLCVERRRDDAPRLLPSRLGSASNDTVRADKQEV